MAETFNKEKFASQASCLSLDVMTDYLHGKLNKTGILQVEKHVADCALCSEALDGLETEGNLESVPFLVDDMKTEFSQKHLTSSRSLNSKGTIYYLYRLTAAAAILVIAVGGFFFIQKYMDKTNPDDLNNIYAQYYQPYPNVITTTLDREMLNSVSVSSENMETTSAAEKYTVDIVSNGGVVENEKTEDLNVAGDEVFGSVAEMNDDATVSKDFSNLDTAKLANVSDNTVGGTTVNPSSFSWTNSSVPAANNSQTTPTNDFTVADKKAEEDLKGKYKITTAKKENIMSEKNTVDGDQPTRSGFFAPQLTSTLENEEILERAMTKYDNNEHDSAIILFNEILTDEPNNVTVQFYQANSYLEEGDLQNGITNLNRVAQQRDNDYYEASQWYLALSYLKAGDKDSATRILNELVFSEGVYKNRAEEVLKLLNK